jgi:tRNA (guanine37-N1)-methyltransferase
MLSSVLDSSILGRARAEGLLTVEAVDIRPYSSLKHKNTDDYPFGGGAGMVMTAQPIVDCVEATRARGFGGPCLYMSPRGKPLTQQKVQALAALEGFVLLCGHYEGVDQRAIDMVVDEEISLGDFVLTGGELAAMAVVDAVARLVPGVLGSSQSAEDESFSAGLLEYPQYTRPREYRGLAVPDVLLNGDHAKINAWRRKQALLTTLRRRPDLFADALMTDRERVETLEAACQADEAERIRALAAGDAPVSACVCAQVEGLAEALAEREALEGAHLKAEVAQARALEKADRQ